MFRRSVVRNDSENRRRSEPASGASRRMSQRGGSERGTRPCSETDVASTIAMLTTQQRWTDLVGHVCSNPDHAKAVLIVMSERRQPSARIALHEACRYKAPVFVVRALLHVHPEGIRCRDSTYHFLPIHFACRYGSAPDVVMALLEAYPESIEKVDKYGSTPTTLVRKSSQPNKEEILRVLSLFTGKSEGEDLLATSQSGEVDRLTRSIRHSVSASDLDPDQPRFFQTSQMPDSARSTEFGLDEVEHQLGSTVPLRRYSYELHNILHDEGCI